MLVNVVQFPTRRTHPATTTAPPQAAPSARNGNRCAVAQDPGTWPSRERPACPATEQGTAMFATAATPPAEPGGGRGPRSMQLVQPTSFRKLTPCSTCPRKRSSSTPLTRCGRLRPPPRRSLSAPSSGATPSRTRSAGNFGAGGGSMDSRELGDPARRTAATAARPRRSGPFRRRSLKSLGLTAPFLAPPGAICRTPRSPRSCLQDPAEERERWDSGPRRSAQHLRDTQALTIRAAQVRDLHE